MLLCSQCVWWRCSSKLQFVYNQSNAHDVNHSKIYTGVYYNNYIYGKIHYNFFYSDAGTDRLRELQRGCGMVEYRPICGWFSSCL